MKRLVSIKSIVHYSSLELCDFCQYFCVFSPLFYLNWQNNERNLKKYFIKICFIIYSGDFESTLLLAPWIKPLNQHFTHVHIVYLKSYLYYSIIQHLTVHILIILSSYQYQINIIFLSFNRKTMNVGAVGALRNIKEAVSVAKHVMKFTQHSFLVGSQATRFALQMGFSKESLATNRSKTIWKDWRSKKCQPNFWTVSILKKLALFTWYF